MPMPDIKVRLATNEEAPIVENLVSEIFEMGDWSPKFENIFPNWLVAEIAGEIVGTVNMRVSNPFTSVEMLAMDPTLTMRERVSVVALLTDSARALAAGNGSVAVSSMIPDDMSEYLEASKRRGYVAGNHGTIVFGRIK
jgi:hypothetical protein